MRSFKRPCSYEELYGLEEELSEMKQEIDIRTNSILFSKFSQQEFPRIKEISIQMKKMAKSYKILNSKFWEDQINKIEEKMEKMERRLFPVKGNKGGIKSRANREKRREKAWREIEEETFNIKKEDRKMTEKDSNKNDWNKEGLWTVNKSYSMRLSDLGLHDDLSRKSRKEKRAREREEEDQESEWYEIIQHIQDSNRYTCCGCCGKCSSQVLHYCTEMEEFILIDQRKYEFWRAKEIKDILKSAHSLCKNKLDMINSMKEDTKMREREKRIENMQVKAKQEQREENKMKVDTPILVQIVKGNGVNIQLKGKCLDTVIENQQG